MFLTKMKTCACVGLRRLAFQSIYLFCCFHGFPLCIVGLLRSLLKLAMRCENAILIQIFISFNILIQILILFNALPVKG